MKAKKVDELIQAIDAMYLSGMSGLTVISGGIDDFLDNYAHGPEGNILGQCTFIKERGVRNDGTRAYAVFERAVIQNPEPHIGVLFVVENRVVSGGGCLSATAIEISQ